MQKKRAALISIILIAIVVVIVIAFVVPLVINSKNKISYRTFANINDVENYFHTYFEIETQNITDNGLADLKPAESFACEFQFEGEFYKIYSYVFADTDDAKAYFENHTGKSAESLSENFSLNSNTYFSTEFTSYKDCNAWHIVGGSLTQFNKMYESLLEAIE